MLGVSVSVYALQTATLNFEQFVEGRRWCPWAREGLEEARVFAGDAPCHGEKIGRASADVARDKV
jgi:hypothetical protein